MYHDFLKPRELQGIHMDTLKTKKSKSITFTVRGGFFTCWAILAHSASYLKTSFYLNPEATDYGRPIKPFFIEILNFWACEDKLGR